MIKNIKNIVSIFLVLIFLMPIATKFFDAFFHHHHDVCFSNTDISCFHEYHKKCPILNFELSFYSLVKQFKKTQKVKYCDAFKIDYFFVYSCNHSKFSFLLRAPPIFTNII
jgi:hypothetical protein